MGRLFTAKARSLKSQRKINREIVIEGESKQKKMKKIYDICPPNLSIERGSRTLDEKKGGITQEDKYNAAQGPTKIVSATDKN